MIDDRIQQLVERRIHEIRLDATSSTAGGSRNSCPR